MKEKKWYQKVSNWLTILFVLVVVPILVCNLVIIYKTYKYPDKIPDLFGYKPFIVLSESMESSINVGDLVIVKNTDVSSLKKGDIIAFRDDDIVITHRIDKIYEDEAKVLFETKGDNNVSVDAQLVNENDIEGVYVTKFSGLGYIFMFFSKPYGLIIIIMAILIIFGGFSLISNSREDKKYRKEFEEFKKSQMNK